MMRFLLSLLGLRLLVWTLAAVIYVAAGAAVMVGLLPAERGAQWFAMATTGVLWSVAGAVEVLVGICWTMVARSSRP